MRHLTLLVLLAASCTSSPPPSGTGAASESPPAQAPALPPQRSAAEAPVPQDEPGARANPFGVPAELDDAADFFPASPKDAAVATPRSVLQSEVGHRPAHHDEVVKLWEQWASSSKRVRLEVTGRTHEGRELLAGVVTSERNQAKLPEILANLHRLADPRSLSAGEAQPIVDSSPAVAWMAYSIHGDELSGVDAGLALAYQLIADQGADTAALLDEVVVVFDPMQNPDGRERYLAMLESSASSVLDLGDDGMARGRWPYGRGNHYLFDMNRDWMSGVAPETRARWAAVRKYVPQLFVDAHEMGSGDTFLFYPQAAPRHPDFPAQLDKWHGVFANECASAFDQHGWSYYSREWADGLGPFYSDSWGALNGAIGILYEQARYAGTAVRRETGEIATYRDAVRHQLTASLSNLRSLKAHRKEVLADFLEHRRASCDATLPGRSRSFLVFAGAQPSRERWLLETLAAQGVELFRAGAEFTATDVVDALGRKADKETFPAGTWIVPAAQPQGALVRAFLTFDPRLDQAVLQEERKELETRGRSKMYDVTAWNLGQALGLDCCWADAPLSGARALRELETRASGVVAASDPAAPVYGWAVDANDDSAVRFAARALAAGIAVHASDEPFTAGGRRFARGSLLVRAHENPTKTAADVEQAATASEAQAFALTTARSPDESADLGGQHFRPLYAPRVAIAGGPSASTDSFGHVWHLVDRELGLPAALIDGAELGSVDLRRYDVIVLPPGNFDLAAIGDDLKAWVRSGGTLIALEDSALTVCRAELGLSQVRERGAVLGELEVYEEAAQREEDARKIEVDPARVYGDVEGAPQEPPEGEGAKKPEKPEKPSKEVLERRDAFHRRFAPGGAILRGRTDPVAWITAGAGEELPVLYSGSHVLLAKPPVRTAVRLAEEGRLRLSGLVWPEARARLARAAWLTVERTGRGQVILFAAAPGFRGFWKSGARLLANAIVCGPGLGADPLRRP